LPVIRARRRMQRNNESFSHSSTPLWTGDNPHPVGLPD
jgi:hypothetical protein